VKFYSAVDDVPAGFGPSAVTIGKFDGVHTGHRAVLDRLRSAAAADSLVSVVVTFDRHPLGLLRPDLCPAALTGNAQKVELLEATGVDATLMLEFDEALSALTPTEFVETILVDALHARIVLVGADFRFGHHGAGTVQSLRELGSTHGFEVVLVDDVLDGSGHRASSTLIREMLTRGDIRGATRLLGYQPTLRSEVVHGHERGRVLGYPTANLTRTPEGYLPADGVYAAWLTVDGEKYPAAVSVGTNPTFGDLEHRQVEAHVIDADLDLYDRVVTLSFVDFIRGMVKFDSAGALAVQMGDDERVIRDVLAADAARPESAASVD
jgi:riboflavin kinase / FMN adenylyltransferase